MGFIGWGSIYHDPFEDTERLNLYQRAGGQIVSSIYHDPFEDTERDEPQAGDVVRVGSIYHDPFEDTERKTNSLTSTCPKSSIYHDPFEDTESGMWHVDVIHNVHVPSTTIRLRILKGFAL